MTKLNFLQEKIMRKNNDFNIFRSQKNNPRILKVTQLIKKTLGEVFLSVDFTNSDGETLMIFVNEVILSKDAKIATVLITSFSNKEIVSNENIKTLIEKNLARIKREFSSRIELKYTPKLKFKIDNANNRILNIDKALDNSKKNFKNEKK